MKKYLLVSLFVLMLAFGFASPVFAQDTQPPCDPLTDPACTVEPAPPPTGFVLPSYLELLLAAGVGFLITQGAKALNIPISGLTAQVTAGLTTALVAFVNSVLQFVPEVAREPVGVVFLLIASIFSAFGIHYTVKGGKSK